MQDLNRVKLISVRIQLITMECGLVVFSEIIAATFFSTASHSLPHPPLTVKIRGVKDDDDAGEGWVHERNFKGRIPRTIQTKRIHKVGVGHMISAL